MCVAYCVRALSRVRVPHSGVKALHMPEEVLMKKLIINADDFGYSVQRNKGIVECFHNKSVTSTSLLVNGVAIDDAVHHIKRLDIPTGMHLNLTEGLPVGQCKSLVDDNGFFLGKIGFRDALREGSIQFPDLYAEIIAQLDLFYEKCCQKPTHVDGHQHVHILPGVRQVFAKVLQEQAITSTRLPVELNLDACTCFSEDLKMFLKGVVDDAVSSKDVFTKHNIRFTDGYVGLSTMGKGMTSDSIMQALTKITNHNPTARTFELMVHPGYPSEDDGGCGCGPDDFSKSDERQHEMRVLDDPHLKRCLRQNGFKLMSFSNMIRTENACYTNGVCSDD